MAVSISSSTALHPAAKVASTSALLVAQEHAVARAPFGKRPASPLHLVVALPEDAVELLLHLLARVHRRPVVDEHGRLYALPLGLVRAVGVRGGRKFRDGRVGGLDHGGLDD